MKNKFQVEIRKICWQLRKPQSICTNLELDVYKQLQIVFIFCRLTFSIKCQKYLCIFKLATMMQISFINKNNKKSRYNCSCVKFFSFDQQIKNLLYKKGNFKLTKFVLTFLKRWYKYMYVYTFQSYKNFSFLLKYCKMILVAQQK